MSLDALKRERGKTRRLTAESSWRFDTAPYFHRTFPVPYAHGVCAFTALDQTVMEKQDCAVLRGRRSAGVVQLMAQIAVKHHLADFAVFAGNMAHFGLLEPPHFAWRPHGHWVARREE